MPITIHCFCKKSFQVPDNLVGKRIKCAKCGRPHRVRAATARPAADDDESYGLAPGDDAPSDAQALVQRSRDEADDEVANDQEDEGGDSGSASKHSLPEKSGGENPEDLPGVLGVLLHFGAPIVAALVCSLIAEGFRSVFVWSFDDGCYGPFDDPALGMYWQAFSESKVWLKMFLWIWRVLAPFGALSCFLAGLKDMKVDPPEEPSATRLVGGGILFVVALPLWAWFPSSKTDVWALSPAGFRTATGEIPWKDIKAIELQNAIDGKESYTGPSKSFEGVKEFKVAITLQSGELQTVVPPLGMRTYEYRPQGEVSLRWGRLEAAKRNEDLWKSAVETHAPHAELNAQVQQKLKFPDGKTDNRTETRVLVAPTNK